MPKKLRKRSPEEVDELRDLVLRALSGTLEGDVLAVLLKYPVGVHLPGLTEATGRSRSAVKNAAERLVERGLALNVDDVRGFRGGKYQGYKFFADPVKFPELEYGSEVLDLSFLDELP